jgi:uncharacterized protein
MKKIILAGGTGFLGNCLRQFYLNKGYEVIILSRIKQPDKPRLFYYEWDGKTLGKWRSALENAEALINLTGKSVDCRYNEKNKKLIYSSRLDATSILGKAVASCNNPPKVWINAASATIYRHSLDKPMDEETGEPGTGFSVDVCQRWEKKFNEQITPYTRKVILRIAIVLGHKEGALQPLKNLVKLGMGGKHGLGNQYFSWIHEKDFASIVDFAIQRREIEGVYNVAAPNPVSNSELMRMLRSKLNMPFGLPMPGWLLEIGAILIRTETELILKSRFVIPKKLLQNNYKFKFPTMDIALQDLLRSKKASL